MDYRPEPNTLWDRTRWPRYAFIAGILLGIILGWFFHQVVSLVMGASFLLILLIPVLFIGYLWLRSRGRGQGAQGPTVVTWRYDATGGPPRLDPTMRGNPQSVDDWFAQMTSDPVNADPRQRRRSGSDGELWSDDDPTDVQDANWTPRS